MDQIITLAIVAFAAIFLIQKAKSTFSGGGGCSGCSASSACSAVRKKGADDCFTSTLPKGTKSGLKAGPDTSGPEGF